MIKNTRRRPAAPVRLMTGSVEEGKTETEFPVNLPDGYYQLDSADRLVKVNPSLCRLLGSTDPEQLHDKSLYDFCSAETRQRLEAAFKQVRRTGEAVASIECPVRRLDGENSDT